MTKTNYEKELVKQVEINEENQDKLVTIEKDDEYIYIEVGRYLEPEKKYQKIKRISVAK